jgi:hypothetical protein
MDAMKEPVENLWRDTLGKGGIACENSWILHKPDTLLSTIKLANLSLRQRFENEEEIEDETLLRTYDFSTLYTLLPHDDLKSRLRNLFTRIFTQQATREYGRFTLLEVSDSSATWRQANTPRLASSTYHTASSLSDHLDHLINNTFVTVGDRIFKQVIGIPMGTNCAVFLANFFLFTYELDFATRLIDSGQSAILAHFAHTKRYIDDILSINNPHFDNLHSSIYPSCLPLNAEHSGHSVAFLDFLLYKTSSKRTPLRSKLFDKRTAPKYSSLPLTHYPHSTSFLPSKFMYNIVISQAFRLLRRCTSKRSFVFNLATIIHDLTHKGLSLHRLLRKARSFAKGHLPTHFKFHSVNHFLSILRRRIKLLQTS